MSSMRINQFISFILIAVSAATFGACGGGSDQEKFPILGKWEDKTSSFDITKDQLTMISGTVKVVLSISLDDKSMKINEIISMHQDDQEVDLSIIPQDVLETILKTIYYR